MRLEHLEDRRLMAGDITAQISDGTLYITGDDNHNHIEIHPSNGAILIKNTEPVDSRYPISEFTRTGTVFFNDYYTLVNGRHSAAISGAFNSISIALGGGDDSVYVHDINVSLDLSVRLGVGADELDVKQTTVGDDLLVWTEGTGGYGRDVIDIADTAVGRASLTNNDLLVYGTDSTETVYIHNVDVEDDLLLYLTKAGEADRAYLYESVAVQGDSAGGLARIDSDYLYARDLDVAGSADFRHVNQLYAYDSVFSDDLWVDGTNEADSHFLSNMQVGDRADIDGLDGNDNIRVYGNQGFFLNGGPGNDRLQGGDGPDVLEGEAGDDVLLGMGGVDQLFGGDNNDWLEAGAAEEFADGGDGRDFNAHRWTIAGQSATDIDQTQTLRCVVLSAMAGAVDQGIDLAGRINYLGDFRYRVKLFDPAQNVWVDVEVPFDGTLVTKSDGGQVDPGLGDSDSGVSEFWTILYQRAYVKHFYNVDPLNGNVVAALPGEPFHQRALQAITGWSTSQVDWWLPVVGYLKSDSTLFNELRQAVDRGDVVTVGGTGHAYYVKNVFQQGGQLKVTLYNPWGSDATHTPDSTNPDASQIKFEADGSNDGLITMMLSDMRKNFHRYFRATHP